MKKLLICLVLLSIIINGELFAEQHKAVVKSKSQSAASKQKNKKNLRPSTTHINSASMRNARSNLVYTNSSDINKFIPTASSDMAIYAVDALTGKVLFSKKAYETRYPASLTKLMTLYILFEKLDNNSISLNDKISFSKYASSKPASKLGITAGDTVTVKQAIDALIVLSANDVATALGEHLGGSEVNFSRIMNKKAQELRMYSTHFSNASGLFNPAQHTTAADMVRLGVSLRNNFPQYYKYFSKTEFEFRGRKIKGHNSITRDYEGAEGLKTGYISQAGYNLISSAQRNQKIVFATVLGGKTAGERDLYMRKILDASFSKIENNRVRL